MHVTTGRRLREAVPEADSIAVMLDGDGAFRALPAEDFDIYWGAYLGMERGDRRSPGRSPRSASASSQLREAARAAHGWIMDTYLLRRR